MLPTLGAWCENSEVTSLARPPDRRSREDIVTRNKKEKEERSIVGGPRLVARVLMLVTREILVAPHLGVLVTAICSSRSSLEHVRTPDLHRNRGLWHLALGCSQLSTLCKLAHSERTWKSQLLKAHGKRRALWVNMEQPFCEYINVRSNLDVHELQCRAGVLLRSTSTGIRRCLTESDAGDVFSASTWKLLGWRPSLLGWRPSLLGWRPSHSGWRPSLLGWN